MHNHSIYVLHEYGAPSHYNALVELGLKHNFKIKFRIFSLNHILQSIVKFNFKIAIINLAFLLSLPFRKRLNIVLGIAPFNPKLSTLLKLLHNHNIFYHTSYTHWDGSLVAHKPRTPKDINLWRDFTKHTARHIFAVSEKTKQELVNNNFATCDKITVVNHSYTIPIIPIPKSKNNTFIYVGRLTENKGISEILNFFASTTHANLIIAGKGEKINLVKEFDKHYNNIKYVGYVNGLTNLLPFYGQADFVIMNSHRSSSWEELFGISIIEGMACGCVPLATDHSGPREIIKNGINGFITFEGNMPNLLSQMISLKDEEYQKIKTNAINTGQSFHCNIIANRWLPILKNL